jgi:hypothetical protein
MGLSPSYSGISSSLTKMISANGTSKFERDFSMKMVFAEPGCSGLQQFPGFQGVNNSDSAIFMSCDNGVTWTGVSDYTSFFSMWLPNQVPIYGPNLTVADRQFIVMDNGKDNASYVNVTESNASGTLPANIKSPPRQRVTSLWRFVLVINVRQERPLIAGSSDLTSHLPDFYAGLT